MRPRSSGRSSSSTLGSCVALIALIACSAAPKPPAPPVIAPPPVVEKPLVVAPLPAAPDRLPHTFEPTRYAARLHVDPQQPSFSGSIEISGTLAEPSALIWLNAEDLTINRVTATRDGTAVRMKSTYVRQGLLALQAEQPLDAAAWTISITYSGLWHMTHATGGFRQQAAARWYVLTQFEPDFGRRVFPCFDEPDRKVPWQLTLDVPDALVAASNAPVESETRSGGALATKTVRFAPTLPLPSYLVAFAVGPFAIVDAGRTKRGLPVRILTLEHEATSATRAVAATSGLIDAVEDWLDVPFPYPKLDLVEVPETEQWWLAMENAGLITFRAGLLEAKEWDAVMTHEIAHHWFGDLVTPAWWDDIWLNESFAAWAVDRLMREPAQSDDVPELPIAPSFVDKPRRDLGSNEIYNSAARAGIQKGQQFLGLFESLIGGDAMQRSLKRYLTKHAHGTVRSDDLVRAFGEVAGEDAAHVVDRYLNTPSAPIAIELRCSAGSHRVDITGFETIGLVCLTYDHDGARRDRCDRVGWGSASIELGTKKCPRWLLPKAPHEIDWRPAQLEAIRDHAWPHLTDGEQLAIVRSILGHDPSKGRLRLSFIERAAGSAELWLISWITSYLLSIEHEIPQSLRAQYDTWIAKTFGARARAVPIAPGDKPAPELVSLLFLVARRDSALQRELLALRPRASELDVRIRILTMQAAIVSDPTAADDLVAELAAANNERAGEIVFALDAVPDLFSFMQRHVVELRKAGAFHTLRLFRALCDGTRRADVMNLGKQLFDKWTEFQMRDFDWCVRERQALEPELRAFLNAKP